MPRPWPPCPPWALSCPLAIIVTSIYLYGIDFLVYGFLAGEYFAVPGMKENPDMIIMIIAYLVAGYLLVLSFSYYRDIPKYVDSNEVLDDGKQGLIFGAFVGLLIALPSALIYNSVMEDWALVPLLVEAAYRVVQTAIGGWIAAQMIARKKMPV